MGELRRCGGSVEGTYERSRGGNECDITYVTDALISAGRIINAWHADICFSASCVVLS